MQQLKGTYMNIFLAALCFVASATALYSLYFVKPENEADSVLLLRAFVFSVPTCVFLGVWVVLDGISRDPRPFDFAGLAGLTLVYMLRYATVPTWGGPLKGPISSGRRYNRAKATYLVLACAALAILVHRVRG